MVNRPLEDVRPVGPLVDLDSSKNSSEHSDEDSSSEDDPILETAENWYESIAKEKNKRKMMKNYFRSVTDLDESEIEQKLDKAGL